MSDGRLGDRAVQRGFLTRVQLAAFLLEKEDSTPLVEFLLARNVITREQADELLTEGDTVAQDPEKEFHRFLLVSLLGRGGMASVWRAYDRELGRHVALKIFEGGAGPSVDRFLREAKLAARLEHPNIARVYEAGSWQGRHYIVMQLVEGKSLREQRLPLRDALGVIAKAARAIHEAHLQGIVHRDLKPGNIMLAPRGEPVILDFGLAKDLEVGERVSVSGTVLGTPAYMAPEQARGEVDGIDARTDVYALGATAYELITGRAPFDGSRVVEVLMQVQYDDPARPRKLDATIPWEVETIVLKALEKEPSRRYPSAKDFAEDVERFLRGEPIRARRSSVWYRMTKRIRRRPVVSAAVAAAVVAGVIVGSVWSGAETERRAELVRLLEGGRRRLREGDAQGALEAAARARAIDETEAGALWRDAKRELDRLAGERERLGKLEEERVAVEPMLRRLWEIDLAAAAGSPRSFAVEAEEMIESAERVTARHPDWGGGWLALGWSRRVRWRGGGAQAQVDGALSDLNLAVQRAGDLYKADALYQRGRLFAERVRDRVGEFAGSFLFVGGQRKAVWARRMPQDAETREWIERALGDLRARTSIKMNESGKAFVEALLEFLQGKPQEAIDVLARADAGTLDALLLRAECEFYGLGSGRLREDVARVAESSGRPDALYLAALMSYTEGQAANAVRCFSRLIEREPGRSPFWSLRGLAKRAAGDGAGAFEDFSKAIDLDPAAGRPYSQRAVLRFAGGEREAAMADHDKAVELAPTDAAVFVNRANARLYLGRPDQAMEDYDRAIELEPSAAALMNRAMAKTALRDAEGALADLDRAIGLDPTLAAAHLNRGHVRSARGDLRGAIQDFDRALELSPKMPEAYANRGFAHEALARGDAETREEHLRAAEQDLLKALEHSTPRWGYRQAAEAGLDRVRRALARPDDY